MSVFKLPLLYDSIPFNEKYKVREQYVIEQKGLCYYCKQPLDGPPPESI